MVWTVEYTTASRKQLKKLDPQIARRIILFIQEMADSKFPYMNAKTLTGDWAGHLRYRLGDYRVICVLNDQKLEITVVRAGHRSDVYRR